MKAPMHDPKPERELTRPEHPKQALAPFRQHMRLIIMALTILVAGVTLLVLKLESNREQAAIAAAKEAQAQERAAYSAQLRQSIITLYKGGSQNAEQLALVGRVGNAISQKTDAKGKTPPLKFHLMAEENAINLYALANGEVFVTTALINRMKTEGQLAAALAHGAAHALAGDVPEPLSAEDTTQWHYTIAQERAADALAVKLMAQAGYDPTAMIGMFSVLTDAYQAKADVAFFITHPNEKDRLQSIQNAITALYPQGIPAVLSK